MRCSHRYKFVRNIAFLLLVTLMSLSSACFAQSNDAALGGVVEDKSGAVIANVAVRITSVETGVTRNVTTNGSGAFNVPGLIPGKYSVHVEHSGFATVEVSDITLNVADNRQLEIKLPLGSSLESVTVDANGTTINTTDAAVSTVIDRQFVENLPLNGRSFQTLLYLTPGVGFNSGASESSGYAQGQFVVNGQRSDSNYWMVDGVSANVGVGAFSPGNGTGGSVAATNILGGTSALVSVDALQEFRIETSTYSPEFGREPGGQIAIQTRPGTNQFHGTLFDYLRNGDLDAKDWFADHFALAKPLEIQNDFGGVLGGPILKDKTFFFFSAEGLRLLQPATFQGTVPDMASRAAAIPALQPYMNAYPVPQPGAQEVPDVPGIVTYNATLSNPGTADAYSLRIDHQLSSSLNVFARYNHAPSSLQQRAGVGMPANGILKITSVTKTATVGATWAKSAQTVDDLRFNYSVSGGDSYFHSDSFGGGTPYPGDGLLPPPYTFQNASTYFWPLVGSNMVQEHGFYYGNFQHQYNLVDTLSLQKGAHSLKFGVDYRRLSPHFEEAPLQLGAFFDSVADILAGNTSSLQLYVNPPGTVILRNLGLFGQDTWRIGSRLNLTYGLRWDVDFTPTSQSGPAVPALTGFSLTNLANLALAPEGTQAYATRYGNVAPRIGGAYRFLTDPDWGLVMRAGFGVFYGLSGTELLNESLAVGYYPFEVVTSYQNVPFPTPLQYSTPPPIEPPNIENGETLFGMDPHLNLPYALEWNVALEQSLGKAQTFKLSYVGASNKRMLETEVVTNPNPNYAAAALIGNTGTLNYNALQAQLQRRLMNGLQALVSYSWAHSIDNGSYGAYSNGNLAGVNANRGDSDYDVRNAFTVAITYDMPALRNNMFTRAITSGWSTDNVAQIRSGAPIDIIDANFAALYHQDAAVVIRPDAVPGQAKYLTGSQYPGRKAINPASVTSPPVDPVSGNPLRQGNLQRNAFRAMGLSQWDFAAHREFPIYEGLKLQFRAELFNILNHPNFGPFNNQFQTGNLYFGQSTQMLNQYLGGSYGGQNPLYAPGSARSGELALKLVF
jgi:Carboxypeptidase regulatory-like domain/TonB dependent receptor-like, beta-barrel